VGVWKSRGKKRRVLAILAVVGLLGIGAATLLWVRSRRGRPTGLHTLAAMSRSRPVQGRFSGNIPYAPFVQPDSPPRIRGSAQPRPKQKDPETLERMRAKAEVFAADVERPTARTKADIGIAFLYEGDFPEAVKQLKQAAADAPGEARIHNDLSVAELALAQETGDSEQLLAAAESSGLAARIGSDIPEILFNHALALEALHLSNQARRAWDEYLKLDAESAWAVEARARRAALDKPTTAAQWDQLKGELLRRAKAGDGDGVRNIVEQFPGMARNYVRDELFAAWAGAAAAGDGESSQRLRLACSVAGEAFERLHHDRFIADAARILERAKESSGALSEAHLALRSAQTYYEKKDLISARHNFEQAQAGFAKAGDPAFEAYAAVGVASCDFHHYRYEETLRALERLRPFAKQRDYLNLLGRTWWIAGTVFLKRGETREAVYAYQSALTLYSQTEDWESHAHISVLLGNAFDILGKTQVAYTYWVDGLKNFDRVNTASRRSALWNIIAIALARNRRVGIALSFAQEAMDTAVAAQDACELPKAFYVKGGLYRETGDLTRAHADLKEALRLADRCPDRTLRGEMIANALLCQGALDLAESPERAIQSLDEACDFLDASDYRYLSEEAHLLRARARRRLGDIDGGEQDLRAALAELDRDRQSFGYGHSLVSFDGPEAVFEEMIDLQIKNRNRPDLAFHYADASRSSRLRQQLLGNRSFAAPAATLAKVRQSLPNRVTLIEYALAADRFYIWVIRRGKDQVIERPLGKAKLWEMIKSFQSRIEEATSAQETLSESALLYEELIRPVEGLIPQTDRVVIIPDGPLQGFPFAALFDESSRRYLVQAWAISTAPSADLFLIASEQSTRLGVAAPASALVVGDPSFDRESLPELLPLPGAEREAVRVAALYPRKNLLLGPEATKREFLEEAGKYEIVHFAGHALANYAPELSALIFAPDLEEQGERDRGKLFAYQLKGLRFSRTRLVVLAGCRTGQVGRWRGEGVAGLVSPFLGAGVPAVVSSLWDVDDSAALLISTRLHQKLREGASASEALRQAQLEMIASPDARIRAPWTWASLQVIGG
jgi:CHAT domain-containing protein/predicted negative regulator of RcsB-dependent stress response